jgi:hypothetical protein
MYQYGRAMNLVAEYDHTRYDGEHAHHRFHHDFEGEQHGVKVPAALVSLTTRREFRLAVVVAATVAAALAVVVL